MGLKIGGGSSNNRSFKDDKEEIRFLKEIISELNAKVSQLNLKVSNMNSIYENYRLETIHQISKLNSIIDSRNKEIEDLKN